MIKRVLAILLLLSLSSQVLATEINYVWEIPEGWYGYSVVSCTEYRGDFCLITEESGRVQSWAYDGSQWIIQDSNIGTHVLSNLIKYKNSLYLSVAMENDTSSIIQYDGYQWTALNETTGWNVNQMVIHDTLLLALTNQTTQVMEFTGLDWKEATWDDNITDPIESLASYNNRLYVLMEDNQKMYEVHDEPQLMDIPNFGIFPKPMVVYNSLLWSSYRNQIFTYNGYNWTLEKVIDPLQHVTVMSTDDINLYIGTQNIMSENQTQVLVYDGSAFKESDINGNRVFCISTYNSEVYAGTNLGLFKRTEASQEFRQRVNYIIYATLILAIILLLYVGFTWNQGFEDVLLIAGGFALLSVTALLVASPQSYLTYVTLILPIGVFIVLTLILNEYMDVHFDLRYTEKDVRIIVLVLLILLFIEIGLQLFSKALGIGW